jgi:hypothetical protein
MDSKKQIISIIENHVGRDNAITVGEIASLIGRKYYEGMTNPVTRAEIKEIINESRIPIGSCGNGYFIITNYNELNIYVKSLKSRIYGINDRIRAVRNAYWHNKKRRRIKRRKK